MLKSLILVTLALKISYALVDLKLCIKEYITANPKATSSKMFAEFTCLQKTIINHFSWNYVSKMCQNVRHDLNNNQTKKTSNNSMNNYL